MTVLRKTLIGAMAIVCGLIFQLSTADAQYPGRLHPGNVFGNPTASDGDAQDASVSSMLDRALGSTSGSCAYRSSSAWTILPGCSSGGGGGTACIQDYLASVGFTPGATTTLTTTCSIGSAAGLSIYFDGVYQNSNTWSLSSLTVTFDAVIPISTQVVEFRAGTPGSGVIGPSSSIIGHIATFSATNGGSIVDSGIAVSSIPPAPLRGPNPNNFYVATTGVDTSNTCTSALAPCLTLQHAANEAMTAYDAQGSNAVINLAAGTYPAGATIAGSLVGASSGVNGIPASIQIIGAGSASTSVYTYGGGGPGTHTGGQCASQPYPLLIYGATVGIGSITLESACEGAATIFAQTFSNVYTANGDVILFSEYSGLNSVFEMYDHSSFSDGYGFTIEGNASEAISISSQSSVFLNATGAYKVTGNYTNGWIDVFDGSFFNWGEGSFNMIGAVNGPQYQLNIHSYVDSEQNTSPLPGNSPGIIEMESTYYASAASTACVGDQPGCRISTPPSVGSATLVSGSGDHSGGVLIHALGAKSGSVTIATQSLNLGSTGDGGFCGATLDPSSSNWLGLSPQAPEVSYNSSTGALVIYWVTQVGLAAGDYQIDWVCP